MHRYTLWWVCYSVQVWLLEMNCNPALHTNCEVLKDVVPKTVTETLGEKPAGVKMYIYLSCQNQLAFMSCTV